MQLSKPFGEPVIPEPPPIVYHNGEMRGRFRRAYKPVPLSTAAKLFIGFIFLMAFLEWFGGLI